MDETSGATNQTLSDDQPVVARRVRLDEILIPDDVRHHDKADVAVMVDSISAIGVQTPISVTPELLLISGMLRYSASRSLGLDWIDCFVITDPSVQGLWKLSENLHRNSLTALAHATALAQWAEAKAVQIEQVSIGGRGRQGGIANAARLLGVDRNVLRRSAQIAAIPPETRAEIRRAGLDNNQSALLSIASCPISEQLEKIAEYSNGRTTAPAIDPEQQFQKLLLAWKKCDQATKTRFIDSIMQSPNHSASDVTAA